MAEDKWVQFRNEWCNDEAGFLGIAAWISDEELDTPMGITGCDDEFSSRGIRSIRPILDWRTGEVLIEKGEWFAPDMETLAKFRAIIGTRVPDLELHSTQRQYYYDLKQTVAIMRDWLVGVIDTDSLSSFKELIEYEDEDYGKALEAKAPPWLVEIEHKLAEEF